MAKITAQTVLREAAELKDRKSEDYQGSMWTEEDYFNFSTNSPTSICFIPSISAVAFNRRTGRLRM